MTNEERSMLDAKNAAEDRYDLCKSILAELNAGDIDAAKTIIKKDMKIYEDEYLYIPNDSKNNLIELPNYR